VRYCPATVRSTVLSSGDVVIVAGLGLALAAAPLAAAPPRVSAQLDREFQAGVDAFRLGKYDEARAHLEKAESLDPKLPGPHRFLAAVAKAQRRYADCITETRRALQLNPQSREAAGTRKLHDECRAADGRPPFRSDLGENAAIAVTANVSGATVRIGTLRYGGTPVAPRVIKPGFHELEIEKAGWKPAHFAIDALPGIVTDVVVTLEPLEPKSPSAPASPRAAKPAR
jgi:tetratricopeptide (TPR) repeat protein